MAHGRKKPRTPRVLRNPIAHAMLGATCLTPAERDSTLEPTLQCVDYLRRGTATEDHHTIVYSVLMISQGIEDARIVRGLHAHFADARAALDAIRQRATRSGAWLPTALYAQELAAIAEAVRLHEFQLRHISATELHQVATKLALRTINNGGTVERRAAVCTA